jgi:hypothetical protein
MISQERRAVRDNFTSYGSVKARGRHSPAYSTSMMTLPIRPWIFQEIHNRLKLGQGLQGSKFGVF